MLSRLSHDETEDLETYIGAARRRLGARLRDGSAAPPAPRALSNVEAALIDDLVFVVGRLTDRQEIVRDIRALASKYAGLVLIESG